MCGEGRIVFMRFGMAAFVIPCFGGNKVFSGCPVFHNAEISPCLTVPHAKKEKKNTAMIFIPPAIRVKLQSP